MKKFSFYATLFFLSLSSFYTQAQEDANCGIIVDGVKPESIDCWSFGEMDLVFPITDRYKKYQRIDVLLYIVPEDNNTVKTTFLKKFSPESFSDNFGDGKYGVWRILRDKKKDGIKSFEGVYYDRKAFVKYPKGNWCFHLYVKGYVVTGYMIDSNGTKVPTYGDGAILYKSEKIKLLTAGMFAKFDENTGCTVKGQPWSMKIEKSPVYQDDLGIIK